MGKVAKSSRKFQKKHLGAAIAHRRKLKPMKNALRRKQDAIRPAGSEKEKKKVGDQSKLKRVEDMDVDELMRGDFLEDMSDEDEDAASEDDALTEEDKQDEFTDIAPPDLQDEASDEEEDEASDGEGLHNQNKYLWSEVAKHKQELEQLQQKDPEFYQFLQEHDKELLDFDDEDGEGPEEEGEVDKQGQTVEGAGKDDGAASVSLSTALVETWGTAVKEKQHVGALRNLLRAFRTACHYGDGEMDELASKYNIASSHVFNKIMLFVLVEMDGILKQILGSGDTAEKMGGALDVQKLSKWKKVEPFVKTFLGNVLHILNQMTDNEMISFTLRRLKASVMFLGAFPRLARKYLKVALHFWGSGEGALPLLAFMFIREMAIQLGSDYLDTCLKGLYKEYAARCKFVNVTSQPRIHFMASCVVELYGIDMTASYQHAFIFIRQLAIVLRSGLTMKTKEAFKQVYSWQYINSLNVWVRVVSSYSDQQLRPLVYPLSQVIDGVARLVPTAQYFPLRLQAVQMLNKLSAATGCFVPVASVLLDMLQFKELHMNPMGGVGKALDFATTLKVGKMAVKTRAFQEECVTVVVEQLTEHLAQWSYAIAFPELAVVPLVQLRRLIKDTTVDRFRRQVKLLVDQIERNVEFVGKKRDGVAFSPKDISAASSFLETEKAAGASPLSQFVISLRQRAAQRHTALHTSSVLVGGDKEQLGDNNEEDDAKEGAKVFSKQWLPPKQAKGEKPSKKNKSSAPAADDNEDEDVVEDLLLSSDEDVDGDDNEKEAGGGNSDSDPGEDDHHQAPLRKRKGIGGRKQEPKSELRPSKKGFARSQRGGKSFGSSDSSKKRKAG